MAYYIQKPSTIDKNITVYYSGDRRWSDNINEKKKFSRKSQAMALIGNVDGKNGGWTNATVVSE